MSANPTNVERRLLLNHPAPDMGVMRSVQLSPFTPCLSPSLSIPSTPSVTSSPPLYPSRFDFPFTSTSPGCKALSDSTACPIDHPIFSIDPTVFPIDAKRYSSHFDTTLVRAYNTSALTATRPPSTNSATHDSRTSIARSHARQNASLITPASVYPMSMTSRQTTFRVSLAPVPEHVGGADCEPPPKKKARRAPPGPVTSTSTSTRAQRKGMTARSSILSPPRTRAQPSKHLTIPAPPNEQGEEQTNAAPTKYRFVSVVHSSASSSSSQTRTGAQPLPPAAAAYNNSTGTPCPSSSTLHPPTTQNATPSDVKADSNNSYPETDTPVVLEEHLEDSEDELPFEHGPTELPPRMYPRGVSGAGAGASSVDGGSREGGWYNHIQWRGPGNNYTFNEKPPPHARSLGRIRMRSGPGKNVGWEGNARVAAGGRMGIKTGGSAGLEIGPGSGRGARTGGRSVIYVNGRRCVVGKIPASELEFLPILEARITALEDAFARVVTLRGEQTLTNVTLPRCKEPDKILPKSQVNPEDILSKGKGKKVWEKEPDTG